MNFAEPGSTKHAADRLRRPTNLLYSELEDDLRAGVRKLLADRCDPATVLARVETDKPYDPDLWRTLAAEMGLAGLLIPEEAGGARECAVVLEELGRAAAPLPFLGSAVLATSALANAGSEAAGTLLADLASGERTATLAVPLSTAPGAPFPSTVGAGENGLHGVVTSVVDLEVADVVLVPGRAAEGPGLFAVERTAVDVQPITPLDLTRRIARLELRSAKAQLVAGPDRARSAFQAALTAGAGLLASEQLGVAEWCLDTTVGYVSNRYQFGRPVGSFQAVKHRLADVWAGVTSARAVARTAADALATASDEVDLSVALAQAHCSDVAVLAAEECIQFHGGIGMTWEHPGHLYLGRAKSSQIALGTPERHRATIAELVDLPAATGEPGDHR